MVITFVVRMVMGVFMPVLLVTPAVKTSECKKIHSAFLSQVKRQQFINITCVMMLSMCACGQAVGFAPVSSYLWLQAES